MTPLFSVLPGHDLAYNEVVRPTRRWAFSYYFLYRWLPLLHPQQAMTIQVLRQCTWQGGRPTGQCQLANATLCRLLGWAESSHKSLLAELERPWSPWFVRRERTRKRHVTEGHAVEGAPRYRVTMDDPLTPRDQAALRALLATQNPATPYEAAELLADLAGRRTRELWALLDAQPVAEPLPTQPATVADIARLAWPHLPSPIPDHARALAETAERCHLRLTGSGYAHMELDYLLRSWLPTLGINPTWLVIVLRARCFHDPHTHETRDTVTVSRRELEAQLAIPERTFRRLLRDEGTLPLFRISPVGQAADPAQPRAIPQRGDLAFHLAFPLLPIAPADQPRYERLLLGREATDEALLSTSGHSAPLDAANQPRWPAATLHKGPADPAEGGQPTRLISKDAATQPGPTRPPNPAEPQGSGQPARLYGASQPTIQKAGKGKKLHSNKPTAAQPSFGRGEAGTTAEIRRLLDPFHIQAMAQILQNGDLTVAEVRGWILRGQEEVEAAQMGGYLFRRLRVGREQAGAEPLPTPYRLAGEVGEAEAAQFEAWWLAERRAPPFVDDAQRARYGAWLKIIKREAGDPERPDFSPHACWRRELARAQAIS